jgi:hypothetical protein
VDRIAALAMPELRARLEEKCLSEATSFGCRSLPEPLPAKGPSRTALWRAVPDAIRWITTGDGEITWSVHGAVFRYPGARAILELFDRVTSGLPFEAGMLVDALSDEEVDASALLHILSILEAHGGLRQEPRRTRLLHLDEEAQLPVAHHEEVELALLRVAEEMEREVAEPVVRPEVNGLEER